MTTFLLYSPTVFSYNWPFDDPRHRKLGRRVTNPLYEDAVEHHSVGDTVRHYAGAPGTGHVDYVITRIDGSGVYAREINNTIRELQPHEVK